MKVAKVSHIVRGFVKVSSTHMPSPPRIDENTTICAELISPRAEGRQAVRRINASTFCSTRQLIANAAPANSQIPIVPPISGFHGTMPRVDRNIPITAQNTASCVTRGLVNAQYWAMRLPLDGVTTVAVMAGSGAGAASLYGCGGGMGATGNEAKV